MAFVKRVNLEKTERMQSCKEHKSNQSVYLIFINMPSCTAMWLYNRLSNHAGDQTYHCSLCEWVNLILGGDLNVSGSRRNVSNLPVICNHMLLCWHTCIGLYVLTMYIESVTNTQPCVCTASAMWV